jgi:ribosomal protein S27E
MGLSIESAKRWVWNGGSTFRCPHCNKIQTGLPSSCSHIKCLDCGVWVKN